MSFEIFNNITITLFIYILIKRKNAMQNMSMVLPVATTLFFISTILSMSIFTNISVFAQSEETNQTGESLKQNAKDIVSNISKEVKNKGSNITKEVAKDVTANIGKQLQDLAK